MEVIISLAATNYLYMSRRALQLGIEILPCLILLVKVSGSQPLFWLRHTLFGLGLETHVNIQNLV